jgi:hypothetical protein
MIAAYSKSLCKFIVDARYYSIVPEISEDNIALCSQLVDSVSDFDGGCAKFCEEFLRL